MAIFYSYVKLPEGNNCRLGFMQQNLGNQATETGIWYRFINKQATGSIIWIHYCNIAAKSPLDMGRNFQMQWGKWCLKILVPSGNLTLPWRQSWRKVNQRLSRCQMASLMLKLIRFPVEFPLHFGDISIYIYIPFSIQSGNPSRSRCDLGLISSIGFISGFQSVEPFLHWKSADPFNHFWWHQPVLVLSSRFGDSHRFWLATAKLIYRAISLMHRIE